MLRSILCITLALTSSATLTGCRIEGGATAGAASFVTTDRIADAMNAAPVAIAQHATIMDRPATPDGEPALLRAGTNGWTCTPSSDAARRAGRRNSSCVDERARAWYEAHSARQTPRLDAVGLNYKLMGDNGASNIDPFATGPTPDNEWVVMGPHVIIFVPDVADLAGLTSDPTSDGPYVMWQGTPYAHIMMPLADGPSGPLGAQTAVSDSAEFVAWRTAQQEDVDELRRKLVALAAAIPPEKLNWRPMEGTRSFRDVFAHIAAEGNIVPVGFGQPPMPGSVADFDVEEARLGALPDDDLVAAMDRAMQNLSAAIAALSPSSLKVPITYFGRNALPRIAISRILGDLHEHLGQLISYARMNQIAPPWSREGGRI